MGLFSGLLSSIGDAYHDVFGGGDPQPKKNQNNSAPAKSSGAQMPAVYSSPNIVQGAAPAPAAPQLHIHLAQPLPPPPSIDLTNQNNQNLNAAPIQQPQPQQGASIFHDLTHNPLTNFVGNSIVKPFAGTAEYAAGEVGSKIGNAITGEHLTPEQAMASSPLLRKINNFATGDVPQSQPGSDVLQYKDPFVASQAIPNALETGANILAPGISKLATAGATGAAAYIAPKATAEAINLARLGLNTVRNPLVDNLVKVGGDALTGGTINSIYGGSQAAQQGATAPQVVKSAAESFLPGAAGGAALGYVPAVVRGAIHGVSDATGALMDKIPTVSADNTPVESGTKGVPAPAAPEAVPGPAAPESGVKPVATATPVPIQNEVPQYAAPVTGGKASVPGTKAVPYSTGDDNLDKIVNDSLIAHKGTSSTAQARADALDAHGIPAEDRAAIRQAAVNNVDKTTGKITAKGVKQIKAILTRDKTPLPEPVAPPVEPAPAAPPVEPAPAAAPPSEPAAPPQAAPTINKSGNPLTDLENAAKAHAHTLDNGVSLGNNNGLKGLLDRVNAHFSGNNRISGAFHEALDTVLTKGQQANVQEALQTGNVSKLTGDEAAVAKILQENVHSPADTLRSSTDPNYTAKENYSPQVGMGKSIVNAAKGAVKSSGLTNKVNAFNDLLQKSRFSETSTLGKFTDATGKSVYGDASDLGLAAKKDGSYVDKSGKVYEHSSASNAEIQANNPNVKLQSLSDGSHTYMNDNMNLKVRTQAADEVINNPEKYKLTDKATVNDQPSVVLKGSDGEKHEFFTDEKTQKELVQSGVAQGGMSDHTNLATTLFNKATSGVTQAIVANPIVHGANQFAQGLIASGIQKEGIGGLDFLKSSFNHTADDALAAERAGVHMPTYGKGTEGVLSKLTFGGSKLSEKAMSALDGTFRVGTFKSLVKNGMDPEEAATRVNQFMGDRHVFDNAQPHITMFLHYFKTEVTSFGRTVGLAAHGHPGAAINAAGVTAGYYGLQKAWDAYTGNPNATIHAPGMVGLIKDGVGIGDGLVHGDGTGIKNLVTSHLNPLVTQLAEQGLNSNGYGSKIPGSTGGSLPSELAARAKFAAGALPGTNLLVDNGHSAAEKVMNTFGLYTPHLKGDAAATPGSIPGKLLNVNNAKDGSSVAFPKDFTGEQESKAYTQSLTASKGTYNSKDAATFASQTQAQQKAITQAKVDLKTVGITSSSQVNAYNKLSPADQKSYLSTVSELNKSGTTASTKNIAEQALRDNNSSLAGSLNTTLPGNTNSAQEAIDKADFIKSGQQEVTKNGMVYQNLGNGKVDAKQQKDYDYTQADKAMTLAKSINDSTGFAKGSSDLQGNITWQMNHADLTDAQRDTLAEKYIKTQSEANKVAFENGFKHAKGTPTYTEPAFNGAKPEFTKAIAQSAAKYGVDYKALMSVAAQEGLGGGVGDGGHAFGPFQMNDAGGVLTGKFPTAAAAKAYAESPAGIDDAVKQIKAAIGNKTGAEAVKAIVTGFERSANQPAEFAKALAMYNGGTANLTDMGGTISDSTSSGSGSGGKASEIFKAAGIPSSGKSIVLPTKPSGLTASTLSYKAPTLTAYKASTAKQGNPFVRSITVSKGVR
jgi:hypothetical protein